MTDEQNNINGTEEKPDGSQIARLLIEIQENKLEIARVALRPFSDTYRILQKISTNFDPEKEIPVKLKHLKRAEKALEILCQACFIE